MRRTSLLVEEPFQIALPGIPEAAPKAAPMSPQDELRLLEKKTQEKGISFDELNKIRQIGDCEVQIQTRIGRLHQWLAAH